MVHCCWLLAPKHRVAISRDSRRHIKYGLNYLCFHLCIIHDSCVLHRISQVINHASSMVQHTILRLAKAGLKVV